MTSTQNNRDFTGAGQQPPLIYATFTLRDWLTLGLILILAGWLRLGMPEAVEFFHDEAMVSTLAQEMAQGVRFPLEGIISSVGIPNPPTSIYLMALPYRFTSNPIIATMFIAGLNVLGVGLFWYILRRYYGYGVALVGGLLFAVNPWAVFFSRKIWQQNFWLPFFLLGLLLALYGLWENGALSRRRKAAQALVLPIWLFAFQMHFAAWALLPLYILFVWYGRKQFSRMAFAFSLVLSALVILPYTIGLVRTLQQDPSRISRALSTSSSEDIVFLAPSAPPLIQAFRVATGLELETWVAVGQETDLLQHIPRTDGVWALSGLLLVVGVVTVWRRYDVRRAALLIIWAALPVLFFLPPWTRVFPHYLIGSIPAFAALAGVGGAFLYQLLPPQRFRQTIALVGVGAFALVQALWWVNVQDYLYRTPMDYPAYTTPMGYLTPIRDALHEYDDVVVISGGMFWAFHHEAARWPVMLADTAECVRTLPPDGYAVDPAHPFAVLITPNAGDTPLQRIYGLGEVRTFPTRDTNAVYRLYGPVDAPTWLVQMTSIEPVPFANGVQLTGYAIEGETVYLQWQLPARKPDLQHQYFVHFLDENGDAIGQRDLSFWPGYHWCEGDTLVTWTDGVPNNSTLSALRVGLYTLGTGKDEGQIFPVDILDVMGNPAGQWALISLTTE